MNMSYSSVGAHTKFRFACKMWELLQITILRTNSKIIGIHTFRKIFSQPNSC
ncbi:hypothetical protein LIL_12999 [Leptospira interrogans serovar Linhai str. 56609]|nr:hypothetical protein LIL_12999 [Leptospira interrogans serovar Linhai str. 56609]